VVEKFVDASAENGIDIFRVFDALNDIRNMKKAMEEVRNVGAHLQGAISYTTSPAHSVATFIGMARGPLLAWVRLDLYQGHGRADHAS